MNLRKTLLALPVRKWDEPSRYSILHFVPTGKKHDSGWALMAVVGDGKEIASYCDVVNFTLPILPAQMEYAINSDMEYPSGLIRYHSRRWYFKVGTALSSTEISLEPKS